MFDCDWSSDVCSSDLRSSASMLRCSTPTTAKRKPTSTSQPVTCSPACTTPAPTKSAEIGRASCRERVEDSGGPAPPKTQRDVERSTLAPYVQAHCSET